MTKKWEISAILRDAPDGKLSTRAIVRENGNGTRASVLLSEAELVSSEAIHKYICDRMMIAPENLTWAVFPWEPKR